MQPLHLFKMASTTTLRFFPILLVILLSSQIQGLPSIESGDVELILNTNKLLNGIEGQSNFLQRSMVPFYIKEIVKRFSSIQSLGDVVFNGTNKECAGHTLAWLERVSDIFNNQTMELWALKMFDSYAKFPEGVLSGHLNPMGDYDECINTHATDVTFRNPELAKNYSDISKSFSGRYCTIYIVPAPNETNTLLSNPAIREAVSPEELLKLMAMLEGILVIPSVGTCFPSSCSREEVALLLSNLFKAVLPSIAPRMYYCATDTKADFDAGDISVIALLGTIGAICLIAGIVDLWINRGLEKPPRRGLAMQYLLAFSLITNIRKWLNTRASGDDLGCVHGIRFLSTAWVILAHTYYMVTFVPVWNMVDLKKIHEDWGVMTVLNSTVSVDTFFVLSGMLVAYNVLKMLDRTKGKINIPMFYIHRYLRLTPTYAILIAIMATLFPYFGGGPFWHFMEQWSRICENNWWTNLLYVNNLVNSSFLCQGEAWYLANDMQFYIVSPLFLYPIWRWEIIGLVILGISTLLSILCPALMVYFMQVPPTTIGTRVLTHDGHDWFKDIYIKPWSRIQTYFVGIFLGYLLYKVKGKKVKIPVLVQLLGWIISTGTCLAVLYGIFPYFDPSKEIPRIEGLLYAGLNRFGWGVSVAWIIYACCKGYGGLVNDFLSWNAFIPLGRLCFCVYLVSLHLQMVLHFSTRQAMHFAPYSMANEYFSHMVMSFMVGFILTITLESPFIVVEKLLFEGAGPPPKKDPNTDGLKRPAERFGIYYANPSPDTVINAEPQKTEL